MSVKSGQAITRIFTTQHPATKAPTDADATPTGTLYVNGTANAATVTVTNITTGVYQAAVTLPALTAGDSVDLRIAATVATVTGTEVIWADTADTKRVSDLNDIAAGAQMDLVNAPNATALTAIKTAMEAAGSTLATLLSRIVGTLLTGNHSPQSGDGYAVVSNATYGNAALKTGIDAIPIDPTEGVTITPATIGTDGLPIDLVMPYGKITAWLDGSPEWRFEADADGDFSYVLPTGSIWTLIAKAPEGDYEDAIATVSTIDIS